MLRRKKAVFLIELVLSVTLMASALAAPTPPVAVFTYTPDAPIFGQVIIFNASASYDPDGGNISSYRWDFDDGTVITVDEPLATHNYTAIGTYNVTLTVTDDEAETDTTWQTVTVREYPVAIFTYSPESPIVGETVTFNASLSTADGGTIMNYTWDFGDEPPVTETDPIATHIYTAFGTYNVALTVTDDEGLTDTCCQSITVRGYPVASFTHSPDRPLVNETVTFDASSSTADGGTIVSYEWNFDDGSNATGEIVNHKYTTFGNYNVTLTVTDTEDLTDTAWKIVTARKLPFATFTYSPDRPVVGETVTFNASLSTPNGGTIMNYTWDFYDGNVTTVTYPVVTHVYTAFGTYNVTLTIVDSEDLTDTFMDTLRILIAPVANFTRSPTKPVINEIVTFDASASDDPDRSIVSYRWDFDDGNVTTVDVEVITHVYTAEGTYNVALTVTDDDGLTDTVWELVTVYTFLYVHDVAITGVTTSGDVYGGQITNITVVAKNKGTAVESFSVTVYYNVTSVGTQLVQNLLPGKQTTLTFSWNTTGVTLGTYTISAQASRVSDETNITDNDFIDGEIKVKLLGDVNGDFMVTGLDVLIVTSLVNFMQTVPPADPYADVSGDGMVTGLDVLIVTSIENFMKAWPP